MKNIVILFFCMISHVYGQEVLTTSLKGYELIGDIKKIENFEIPNSKEVYIMGRKFCYLGEHMTKGFAGVERYYEGDASWFNDRAKDFMDSVINRYGIKNSMLKTDIWGINFKERKYSFITYERTHDCEERYYTKNYRGRVRGNNVYILYFKSDKNTYEQLRIYIVR